MLGRTFIVMISYLEKERHIILHLNCQPVSASLVHSYLCPPSPSTFLHPQYIHCRYTTIQLQWTIGFTLRDSPDCYLSNMRFAQGSNC